MSNLNKQQQEICDAPVKGAYRILAGPGSGKTHTLIQRIGFLIEQGVDPKSILAVTFSKAMADELSTKAYNFSPVVYTEQICTIHALTYRILKEEGDKRQVASGKTGYMIKKCANEAIDKAGISEVGHADFIKYVNNAKFHAIKHNALYAYYRTVLENAGGITADVPWKASAPQKLSEAHIEFDRLMKDANLLTFNDMLCEVEWMFDENPSILSKYQQRFQYIFVDEAQDTSSQAMRILTLLAAPHDNFTAVGDTDQTIYAFAGANPEDNLWQGFEKRFPESATYKLETNYRSSKDIIALTNKAIEANYDEATQRYRKYIQPREGAVDGNGISYEVYNSPYDEAIAVVDKIDDLMWNKDKLPQDFFICARTRSQLPYLYGVLAKHKIPFIDKCGGSFWESAHVADLIAYLRLSLNSSDDEAFLRIYNKASVDMTQPFDLFDKKSRNLIRARGDYVNHRWLGKEFISACNGSFTGIFTISDSRYMVGLNDLKRTMSQLNEFTRPIDKASFIVSQCLRKWWAMEAGTTDVAEDSNISQDFNTLIDIASQYQTLGEFLDYVNSMIELSHNSEGSEQMVVLSTIHRLKGLERPCVFVIGVMEGILPHWAAEGQMKQEGVLPFKHNGSVVDERRLFFVAISRAKEYLFLTGIWNYQSKKLSKSRFCYETELATEEAVKEAETYVDNLSKD